MLKILCKSYFPFVAIVKSLCFSVHACSRSMRNFYGFPQIQTNQRNKKGVRFDEGKAQQATFVFWQWW